jgi:HEAT repeat protein
MRLVKPILLVTAILAFAPARNRAAGDEAVKADEVTLQRAGIATGADDLLQFFRKHTIAPHALHKIQGLIAQLGEDSFEMREKASAELAAFGSVAGPLLRKALDSSDVEVVRRAQRLLQKTDAGPNLGVFIAATRVLAARKPKEAAATLLAFLPFAEAALRDDVHSALAAVAVRGRKPEPALVNALTDPSPLLRAAAGEALLRARVPSLQTALRALLKDPDPEVRKRIALTFCALKDREAVPVLIALLDELPAQQLWQVEDTLYRLAGKNAPDLTAVKDTSPASIRKLWIEWWQANGSQLDLAKIDPDAEALGFTLVAIVSAGRRSGGRVIELGRDGKRRWQIDGIVYPLDVQIVSPNRLLVAENAGNRVTERDLTGRVLWEKQIPLPVACERLPRGTTFIATSSQIVEVDRSGREVFSYQVPRTKGKLVAARKLKNGQIIFVTNPGGITHLDPAGHVVKSFSIGKVSYFASTIDVLPNGRILVPLYIEDRVVEYDLDGNIVWQVKVTGAVSAARLPNGNTLLALPVAKKLVEIDRAGKQISQTTLDGQPRQARRR